MLYNFGSEKKNAIAQHIIVWFEMNEEDFNETIEQLDDVCSWFDGDRYLPMEMLNDAFYDTKPTEIVSRVFYGHDDDSYTVKELSGVKEPAPFNPNREYFYFDGCGNLVSSDVKDYSSYLDEYFVNELLNHRGQMTLSDEVEELLDELAKED
jgi:hypothetical protein